jgi:hypothetical protein
MDFRNATTFTDSLGRLTAPEQNAAKTTAFDLQMDPSAPGLSFHKLDRAKELLVGAGKRRYKADHPPHRSQGHQPPRRRGDEIICGAVMEFRALIPVASSNPP